MQLVCTNVRYYLCVTFSRDAESDQTLRITLHILSTSTSPGISYNSSLILCVWKK